MLYDPSQLSVVVSLFVHSIGKVAKSRITNPKVAKTKARNSKWKQSKWKQQGFLHAALLLTVMSAVGFWSTEKAWTKDGRRDTDKTFVSVANYEMAQENNISNAETATTASVSNIADEVEILVIHSYHSNLFWTRALSEGINQGFQSNITIHHEYLDAKRYPELYHQKEFFEHLEKKYEDTTFSLLMVTDDPGIDLVLANQDSFLSELPTVFMGVNNVQEELLNRP
ncbi:MAG: hypothetical protein AAFU53_12040, partial [Cyanobacteria bacterium J06632_3]